MPTIKALGIGSKNSKSEVVSSTENSVLELSCSKLLMYKSLSSVNLNLHLHEASMFWMESDI